MKLTSILLVICGLWTSAPALAQTDFNLERLRPGIDREAVLDVESGEVGRHLDWDGALWSSYTLNPLVLFSRADGGFTRLGSIVGHRVGAHLVGSIALFDLLKVGLEVPVVVFQAGDPIGGFEQPISPVSLGDIRLVPKLGVLKAADHGVDLAVLAHLTIPTGLGDFAGESTFTVTPELAVSRRLPAWNLRLAGNLGYRVRPESSVLSLSMGHELSYGFGGAYDLGGLYAQVPVELEASLVGAFGVVPLVTEIGGRPIELKLAGRYNAPWQPELQITGGVGFGVAAGAGTPDLRVFLNGRWSPRLRDSDGDGVDDPRDQCPERAEDRDGFEDADGCPDPDNDLDGVPDGVDRCPDEAEDTDGFEDEDGCPDLDNDGDGIADVDDRCPLEAGALAEQGCPLADLDGDGIIEGDRCPEEAEDKDGFEDEDGCPEPDNDNDGIADLDDKCPLEPETINGIEDEDGCPDQGKSLVIVKRKKIEILDRVFFELGSATIGQRSYNLLGQVAAILKANPQVTKARVEGHTDSSGDDKLNKDLSQRRADSVRDFLVERGVEPARLEAVGFGEEQPIAINDTSRGREQNRRVEFNIVEMNGQPVEATPE